MTATPDHEPVPSRIDQSLPLIERLQAECDGVGSVSDYIYALGVSFRNLPEHRANMLQLQRAARLVVDPRGHETDDSMSTDAFYWGEILGYTVCDRSIGSSWPIISRELIDKNCIELLNRLQEPYSDEELGLLDPSTAIIGELEEMDTINPELDDLIGRFADALTENPKLQYHVVLGFRYIMKHVIETATNDVAMANACQSILEANNIELGSSLAIVPIDEHRRKIMEWYANHYLDLKLDEEDDGDTYIENSHDISVALNAEMKLSKILERGDIIQSRGDVLVVTISDDDSLHQAHLFDGGQIFEADYVGLRVFEGPTEAMIPRLKAIRRGEPAQAEQTDHTQSYTVMMEVEHAFVSAPDGEHRFFPENTTTYLVLGNNHISLSRYVL